MQCPVLVLIFFLTSVVAFAQTETARISGRVTDLSGAVIVGAECQITNIETNVSTTTTSNEDGIYVIPDLRPAIYRLTIQKEGFRTVVQPKLQLYVQDAVNENFTLAIGPMSDSVTVVGTPLLQTDSASVSTVVDQQFVQNMPLNGRSFQSLIALTPGVVFISSDIGDGQFSVNGQRSDANYFMVDGVSANFGVSPRFSLDQSIAGSTPGLTSGGGTNGLVSVDAMQEFRIQTSSYAAEFGRTPGAQISIVTKSGTNQFHGTAFDYLRNEIFDARNWFDRLPLVKPPLRQNDFGGTVGGPIIKDKTFFFLSYEGLRLLLPQTATGVFYTASARAAAAPAYQPYMNALPLPTGAPIDPTCDDITNPCLAALSVAYSNPSSLNATSIRIDHSLTNKITLFARYNHAPSHVATRYWEEVLYDNANTDTFTAGITILLTHAKVNDFRANWSRNTGSVIHSLTNFYGAVVPPNSVLFPASTPYSPRTTQALVFFPDGDGNAEVRAGTLAANVERQLNFVDTFSWAVGVHQFKFGIDYRRMNPTSGQSDGWFAIPETYRSIAAGNADSLLVSAKDRISIRMNNYSLFGQDTWRTTQHLTLTYGLRWEINTPPESAMAGQPLYATQGVFDSNPLAIVPGALWHTRFSNFAPRLGAAYQVTPKTVVRREAAEALISMYKRHGTVVRSVLEEQLRTNAPKLIDRTLEGTSLLALAIGQDYLTGREPLAGASPDRGTFPSSEPRNANSLILAKLEEILKEFHRGVDSRTQRRKMTGKPSSPTKRDTILFAAIVSHLEGLKYCGFLDNHRIKPKWSDTGPKSYRESYLANCSYKKKVQDEKSRAKQRMNRFGVSVLPEAFVTHLPGEFDKLVFFLNSRNSRDASKKFRPSTGA